MNTPGYKTSEFWLTILAAVLAAVLGVLEKIEAEWATIAITIVTAAYTFVRGRVKRPGGGAGTGGAASLLIGALLLPWSLLTVVSCGIAANEVTYQRDGYDVTYIRRPDGTTEFRYVEVSTRREYRAFQGETGEWSVEVRDPSTGVWVKYHAESKSPGLSLSLLPPAAREVIAEK